MILPSTYVLKSLRARAFLIHICYLKASDDVDLLLNAYSLDIIGRVAFGHDFQSGQSPEAKLINESWSKDINMGITFAGFLAPFIIGMFPFIASTIGEGVTKRVVSKLAESILDREGHLNNEDGEKKIQDSRNVRSAKDILSLLVQSKRRNGGYGLSNQQIADNVSCRHFLTEFTLLIRYGRDLLYNRLPHSCERAVYPLSAFSNGYETDTMHVQNQYGWSRNVRCHP